MAPLTSLPPFPRRCLPRARARTHVFAVALCLSVSLPVSFSLSLSLSLCLSRSVWLSVVLSLSRARSVFLCVVCLRARSRTREPPGPSWTSNLEDLRQRAHDEACHIAYPCHRPAADRIGGIAGGAPAARRPPRAPIIRIEILHSPTEGASILIRRRRGGRGTEHERRGSSVTKTIRIAALPGAPRHQDGAPKVELASAIYIASQRRRNDDRYTTAATTIHESALSQSAQSHQARVSLTPSGLVVGYRIAGTAVPRPAACQVATALHKAGLCRRFPNVCSHRAFKRHRGARLHQYDFALLAAPVVVPPQPSSSSTAGGAGGAAAHVGYSQVLLCDGAGACCQAPQAR